MRNRFKVILAIGLTLTTILGSCVTTCAASAGAAEAAEGTVLVIENGGIKEEICPENVVFETYDDLNEYHSAVKSLDSSNLKYAPDSYDGKESRYVSNCVILRVNADAALEISAEHIVTVIQYTGNHSYYIQYDSEDAAGEAVKVLNETEGTIYAAQNGIYIWGLDESAQNDLDPEKEAAIRADYLEMRKDPNLKAEEIEIDYLGTWQGGDVIVIRAGLIIPSVQKIQIDKYIFTLPNESDVFCFYKDHTFTPLKEAYEKGLLKTADIAELAGRCGAKVALPFKDVKEGDWFYPYVYELYCQDVVNGIMIEGKPCFFPALDTSRAHFVQILYLALNKPAVENGAQFPDVDMGAFYADAVKWAGSEEAGVTTGYTEGSRKGEFGPMDSITREQMAVMLYRCAEYQNSGVTVTAKSTGFPDEWKVSGFAKEAMLWAVENKVITGDQGRLNPQGTVSRAVCATMVQRYLKLY